jgi:hypothetical protein
MTTDYSKNSIKELIEARDHLLNLLKEVKECERRAVRNKDGSINLSLVIAYEFGDISSAILDRIEALKNEIVRRDPLSEKLEIAGATANAKAKFDQAMMGVFPKIAEQTTWIVNALSKLDVQKGSTDTPV